MDATQSCRTIRDALSKYWGANIEVSAFDDFCIVTLPLRTLDGRFVDVFVEAKFGDMCLVHDGGKSAAELHAQGIHDNKRRLEAFASIGRCYGASFVEDTFSVPCKRADLEQAILSIAQCASLAMHDVATHRPALEDESVKGQVGKTLEEWCPANFGIERDYEVRGAIRRVKHRFDYAALTASSVQRNVAVNVLLPTYNPTIQSRRYGFLVLDLKNTPFASWPKLAVIGRVNDWHSGPLDLVRSLADTTLELTLGDHAAIERELPGIMSRLIRAA